MMVGCLGLAGCSAQEVAGPTVSTITTPAAAPMLTMPVGQLTQQQVATMQRQLADWAQLGRYRNDNAPLGAPKAGELRVVFYGDSITDGWGRTRGKFFPDKPWVNRGISGQTTPQMVVRFQQDVIGLHPEAVVILAGINDIAGNTGAESLGTIEDNFRSMVALAKSAHIRVVLSSVLPAAAFPWHRGVDPREEVVALNQWLQGFASEQGLVFLNYYPALVGPDGGMKAGLAVDGIHPSDAGYAVMEPLARVAVGKALGTAAP
jgi:lysophospholipase L1-like esterase